MNVSQIELREITGMSIQTITGRLRKAGYEAERVGREMQYETKDALPILYGAQNRASQHNLEQERARLASNQADKEALRVEEMRGKLVQTADVLAHWQDVIGACRAKLLNLAQKAAPTVAPLMTVPEVQEEIDRHIHEALQDMADAGGLPEHMVPEEEDVITWEPAA